MAATVNKDEMARLMGVSLPTLTAMIKDNADFPIQAGGSKGVAYAFDPEAVLEWKNAKIAEAREATASKQEFLAQFEFDVAPEGVDAVPNTPGQRLQVAKAVKVERELAIEAGQLVYTASVRQVMQIALATLGKRLDNLPTIIGREFNLPDAVQRAMRRQIDDARTLMVRDIQAAVAAAVQDEALLSAAE